MVDEDLRPSWTEFQETGTLLRFSIMKNDPTLENLSSFARKRLLVLTVLVVAFGTTNIRLDLLTKFDDLFTLHFYIILHKISNIF